MTANMYLRVEAVNLGNVVYDTEDISTIRGSGLLILDLWPIVKKSLAQIHPERTCRLVTNGASQVVIAVIRNPEDSLQTSDTASTESTEKALVDSVRKELRKHPQLQFATLTCEIVSNEYDSARESLIAKTRFRQMQQLRLSPAGITAPTDTVPVDVSTRWCAIDLVRPATRVPSNVRNPDKYRGVSDSIFQRRQYGFDKKQSFYSELEGVMWQPKLPEYSYWEFAWDFHQIAEFDKAVRQLAERGEISPNLDGKLAVIYIDGNGFGKKQRKYCSDEGRQKKYDNQVQGNWRRTIARILNFASRGDEFSTLWWNSSAADADLESNENKKPFRLRLETLLWGGDEVIWVVPAWLGLFTLQMFFSEVEASTLESDRQAFGPLTYSAGLVFCHAEAPIRGVRDLAGELAELCKQDLASRSIEENRFAFAILESFDQLGDDYLRTKRSHLPFPVDFSIPDLRRHLSICPNRFTELCNTFGRMKKEFPRGSVYQILSQLRAATSPPNAAPNSTHLAFERLFERALRDAPQLKQDAEMLRLLNVAKIAREAPDRVDEVCMNWLHLAELWDYILIPNVSNMASCNGGEGQ